MAHVITTRSRGKGEAHGTCTTRSRGQGSADGTQSSNFSPDEPRMYDPPSGWIWQSEQRAHGSYVRSLDLATAVAGPMNRSPWTGWYWNCGGGDWDWRWNESGWRWSGGWRWNGWSWNRGNVA